MNNRIKADRITSVLMNNWLRVLAFLIIIISLTGMCSDDIDPLDNNINRSKEIVDHVIVVDSTLNGFRVVYATTNSVSPERFAEIKSRPHIQKTFNRLKTEAPIHFGSLLDIDIYDFTEYALKFEIDPEIQIHNIFVEGKNKCELYIGPNQIIENPALFFNAGTEQGAQYISHDDIYFRRRKEDRIYRYWKCYGIHAMSYIDERYSHFSEDERVW